MLGLLDRSTPLGMLGAITFQRSAIPQMTRQSVKLLSVIAGMVDLIGFFTLSHVFTAHVAGNIADRRRRLVFAAQLVAIPARTDFRLN